MCMACSEPRSIIPVRPRVIAVIRAETTYRLRAETTTWRSSRGSGACSTSPARSSIFGKPEKNRRTSPWLERLYEACAASRRKEATSTP